MKRSSLRNALIRHGLGAYAQELGLTHKHYPKREVTPKRIAQVLQDLGAPGALLAEMFATYNEEIKVSPHPLTKRTAAHMLHGYKVLHLKESHALFDDWIVTKHNKKFTARIRKDQAIRDCKEAAPLIEHVAHSMQRLGYNTKNFHRLYKNWMQARDDLTKEATRLKRAKLLFEMQVPQVHEATPATLILDYIPTTRFKPSASPHVAAQAIVQATRAMLQSHECLFIHPHHIKRVSHGGVVLESIPLQTRLSTSQVAAIKETTKGHPLFACHERLAKYALPTLNFKQALHTKRRAHAFTQTPKPQEQHHHITTSSLSELLIIGGAALMTGAACCATSPEFWGVTAIGLAAIILGVGVLTYVLSRFLLERDFLYR